MPGTRSSATRRTAARRSAQYAELRPDVVTMDVTMPIASGLEALEAIRELDPDARVVMCSALSSDTTKREAERLGAKGYVVKPFTADDLRHAIGEALQT